jgi:hypothetical protein
LEKYSSVYVPLLDQRSAVPFRNLPSSHTHVLQDTSTIVQRLLDLPGGKRPHEGLLIWEKRCNSFYLINLIDLKPYAPLAVPSRTLFRISDTPLLICRGERKKIPFTEDVPLISFDPGIKPFQQVYIRYTNPLTAETFALLGGDFERGVRERCKAIDALQSRIDIRTAAPRHHTVESNIGSHVPTPSFSQGCRRRSRRSAAQKFHDTTRRLRNKLRRERLRLTHWVKYMHYKSIHQLLRKVHVEDPEGNPIEGPGAILVLPVLQVARLVKKKTNSGHRVLSDSAVRLMLAFSHFKFRQRVTWALRRFHNVYVLFTKESGTTKTCGFCGYWNPQVKLGDEWITCCQ